jgi:hypothetical protein
VSLTEQTGQLSEALAVFKLDDGVPAGAGSGISRLALAFAGKK